MPPGCKVWAIAAPIIRSGRIQLSVPRRRVHEFDEVDYCYGIGPLTLKVDRVGWERPAPSARTGAAVARAAAPQTAATAALRPGRVVRFPRAGLLGRPSEGDAHVGGERIPLAGRLPRPSGHAERDHAADYAVA